MNCTHICAIFTVASCLLANPAMGQNAAVGGAKNDIVNRDMKNGHALIASPAEYGNSGVMTFIVSHDGLVYKKDFGSDTAQAARAVKEYNSHASWRITDSS